MFKVQLSLEAALDNANLVHSQTENSKADQYDSGVTALLQKETCSNVGKHQQNSKRQHYSCTMRFVVYGRSNRIA